MGRGRHTDGCDLGQKQQGTQNALPARRFSCTLKTPGAERQRGVQKTVQQGKFSVLLGRISRFAAQGQLNRQLNRRQGSVRGALLQQPSYTPVAQPASCSW
jgi:hypothetical protein